MSALYTHYVFAQDVYRLLEDSITNKLGDSKKEFYLFAQSFDLLNFIRLPKKNASSYCHNHKVNLYFKNIIDYIISHSLQNNSSVLAYLYGSICHYVLDSTCHPYIFYYTGVYHKENRDTWKYRGLHTYMEYMLDAIIYYDRNKKPIYKTDISKIASKFKFNDDLIKVVDTVYYKTFSLENMGKKINKAYNRSHTVYRIFNNDYFGIKRFIYKIVDFLKFRSKYRFKYYSYYIKKLDYSLLNLEHEKWIYPLDNTKEFHYSFYDLYDIALENAKNIIIMLNQVLNSRENIEQVLDMIGDNKYSTGLPCSIKGAMKYFKF